MRSWASVLVVGVLVATTVVTVAPTAGAKAKKPARVSVRLTEFGVRPSTDVVDPGNVTFVARNAGTEVHELVVARVRTTLPLDADGAVDEDRIPYADAIGEAEDVRPRKSRSIEVVALTPGTYELFCNIVEREDGETVSHYSKGMRELFVVG